MVPADGARNEVLLRSASFSHVVFRFVKILVLAFLCMLSYRALSKYSNSFKMVDIIGRFVLSHVLSPRAVT